MKADSTIYIQPGDIALGGEEHEHLSYHEFEAVNYDRWLTGSGVLIQIYKPKAVEEPVREHKTGSSLVPKDFVVRVIDGSVKMTKSAAG